MGLLYLFYSLYLFRPIVTVFRGIDYYSEDRQDWSKHVGTNINKY